MRVAFVGAAGIAVATAELLIEDGHEVVIVERDKEVIEELSARLDCAFVHGNGSRPNILREVGPDTTDVLFCLTNSDETNIIASLVGRSLGFQRVVPRIEALEFEHICLELGLEHTIVPTRTIARFLVAMVSGQDELAMSAYLSEDVRFFAFVAREEDERTIRELQLPRRARVIYLSRNGQFHTVEGDTTLRAGDEVMVVTHRDGYDTLVKRWRR